MEYFKVCYEYPKNDRTCRLSLFLQGTLNFVERNGEKMYIFKLESESKDLIDDQIVGELGGHLLINDGDLVYDDDGVISIYSSQKDEYQETKTAGQYNMF